MTEKRRKRKKKKKERGTHRIHMRKNYDKSTKFHTCPAPKRFGKKFVCTIRFPSETKHFLCNQFQLSNRYRFIIIMLLLLLVACSWFLCVVTCLFWVHLFPIFHSILPRKKKQTIYQSINRNFYEVTHTIRVFLFSMTPHNLSRCK